MYSLLIIAAQTPQKITDWLNGQRVTGRLVAFGCKDEQTPVNWTAYQVDAAADQSYVVTFAPSKPPSPPAGARVMTGQFYANGAYLDVTIIAT